MNIKQIILFSAITVFSSTSFFAQDLSVFDLKLNEPFNIRECKYTIQENATVNGIPVPKNRGGGLLGSKAKISKMYQYTEDVPDTDKCFQRIGMYYTDSPLPGTREAENLPPVAAPNNQVVKLMYAKDLRPAIADSEDIWVGIQNTKLTGLRFYFRYTNEKNVFQILTKKYGKPSSTQNFDLLTPAGNRKDYYQAKWDFPKLSVTFLSLDTNRIGYDMKNAPLGYLSEVGSVMIQYKITENKPKDNNPL
ncbi:MAG: hypothetical protein K1X72_27875 [Pyrinomonadaceae bacterium]|nr:hypothetical protein [Pyrinomonadaceae bacterium]